MLLGWFLPVGREEASWMAVGAAAVQRAAAVGQPQLSQVQSTALPLARWGQTLHCCWFCPCRLLQQQRCRCYSQQLLLPAVEHPWWQQTGP